MSCLSINLTRHFEFELQSQLLVPLINVSNVAQAINLLEDSDFAFIIEDARNVDRAHDDLAQLLAITPVSTRIIALVNARTVPDADYWHDQGAVLLYEQNEGVLIRQLAKCCRPGRSV
tara:strand:- start:2149 stop:2502 length:354 start_codon:yes stop_codon:yes gene_type:complete